MKELTNDQLGEMIQKEFRGIDKKLEELQGTLKGEIQELRIEMEKGFDEVNLRLDKTVMPELEQHAYRIKKIEQHLDI